MKMKTIGELLEGTEFLGAGQADEPAPADPRCWECGDKGFVVLGDGAAPCRCRHRRYFEALVPARFRGLALGTVEPRPGQRSAAAAMAKNPAQSYFLWGPPGRGKTHLLACQLGTLLEGGRRARMATLPQLTAQLAALACSRDPEWDPWQFIRPGAFLGIDDCHMMKAGGPMTVHLFELIDAAYREGHLLSVTANRPPEGLDSVLDSAIVARLMRHCIAAEVK